MNDGWDRAMLTPWENRDGRWYKRDDLYAPLGPGSINGSKLRQLDYLLEGAAAAGYTEVITGCSILSPQAPMTSIVARRYGLPVTVIAGGTKRETMVKRDNVQIAMAAGARYELIKVGYNPALQAEVRRRVAETPGAYRLCYGITTPEDSPAGNVREFHEVGAPQVTNIPAEVEHLVVPFGSGNTATSILYGLNALADDGVRTPLVTLVGIGPSKLGWMLDRLRAIGGTTSPLDMQLVDLHAAGRYTYSDRQAAERDGIVMHPTYEGKVVTAMDERPDIFPGWAERDGTTALWIVGGEPSAAATFAALEKAS